MPEIFFSYRRKITGGYAGRLRDELSKTYPADQISIDIEIQPGEDFERWIQQRIASCRVLLAIIGPGWAQTTDEAGNVRLQDPRDYARIEIEAGLMRDVRIVPVLVGEAKMPSALELPTSLQQLSRLHAIELSEERWEYDVQRLVAVIERVTDGQIPKVPTRPPVTGSFGSPPPTGSTPTFVLDETDFDVEFKSPVQVHAAPPPVYAGLPGPLPGGQHANISAAPHADSAPFDRVKPFVIWGWILATAGTLLFAFVALLAIVFGGLVIARSDGRRTGTGVGIILVAIFMAAVSYTLGESMG